MLEQRTTATSCPAACCCSLSSSALPKRSCCSLAPPLVHLVKLSTCGTQHRAVFSRRQPGRLAWGRQRPCCQQLCQPLPHLPAQGPLVDGQGDVEARRPVAPRQAQLLQALELDLPAAGSMDAALVDVAAAGPKATALPFATEHRGN
jgi:hypothetical protein